MINHFLAKYFRVIPLILILIIFFTTCEKPERIAEIESSTVLDADISYTSVLLKGEITDLGSAPVEDFGIIISENASFLNPIPLSANLQAKRGSFQIEFTGLKINTLYYFRAYLTISGEDPIYGKTLQFRTKDYSSPAVSIGAVSLLNMSSATVSGEVTNDGGETATIRGLCWGSVPNPTIANCIDTTVNGTGKGTFSGSISGLTAGNRYYVRTYARNSKGLVYNSNADLEIKTHDLPEVTTTAITNISANGCSSGGNVTDDGEVPVTARGVCWSTSSGPTADLPTKTVDGSGKGEFTSVINGLNPGVLYYVRAYATNQYGTSYGSELPFTTFKAPDILTLAATLMGNTTVTLNGSVNPNGFSTTLTFEYGQTTAYGSAIAANPSPVSGSSGTNVSANLTGLTPGTTYHFRLTGTNSGGTVNGTDLTFTTLQPSNAITDPASYITTTAATLNGRVNANNSSSMVSFEYGTTDSYGLTIAATPGTVTGNTLTAVSAVLSGLSPGTEYHYRVRSVSDGGTSYGTDATFTTLHVPVVATNPATGIGNTSATLNGTVDAYNSDATVSFEWGTSTVYGNSINAAPPVVTGNTNTAVSAVLSGLTPATTYHYRVKAVSAAGTSYGNDVEFPTTSNFVPTLTTTSITALSSTSATTGGTITSDGGSAISARGVCWSTSANPTTSDLKTNDGSGTGSFTSAITGLTAGTTYYVRAYAVNSTGTGYGNDVTFTTPVPPVATTSSATAVSSTSAVLNGSVNANNSSTTVTFEYGLSTAYGTSVAASESPVTGSSSTLVSTGLSGLSPSTTYHFRVKAESAGGTVYGNDMTFTTNAPVVTVTDYEGNIYNTVLIGTQRWMSRNLLATRLNDGTSIALVSDQAAWSALTTPGYIWYNNDQLTNKDKYGALYNWYAVNTGYLCPTGWHVPSDDEFTTLVDFLGGATGAGGPLKEVGTANWLTPNTGATNSSGFTGLPGGVRYDNGTYALVSYYGYWWSRTEQSSSSSWYRYLYYNNASVGKTYDNKKRGKSVRCVEGPVPFALTSAVSDLASVSATLNGSVYANGASTAVTFEYGTSASYGSTATAAQSPVSGATPVGVTFSLSGLTPGTEYHYRVKAVNSGGTVYGADQTFTTQSPPTVVTGAASAVTHNSATLAGTVNANGLYTVIVFEYGLTTAYGSSIGSTPGDATGTSVTPVSETISGLSASTTYHYRIKAWSSAGTSYGSDATFTTGSAPLTVTDIDGNVYNTVTIGTQEWLQSNLKTTHYNNGEEIPEITDNGAWAGLTSGAFSWYNNDAVTYKDTYGALYNWYTTTDIRNVCPSGWHVPSDVEWTTLVTFLGGESVAGGKLKELGTTHWAAPNTGATNESGFTGIPNGMRAEYGNFFNIPIISNIWSSTEISTSNSSYLQLNKDNTTFIKYDYFKNLGNAIRCVKGPLPASQSELPVAVSSTSVTLNGKVNPNGASATVTFEYGTTTSYGSQITASQSPVTGAIPVDVSYNLTGLTPNTTYHYRVKAVNSGGTSYGAGMTFTTPATVADVDGNVYNTVIIGTQTWLQSNLKTTHYSNGEVIPEITDNGTWAGLTTGALSWYNNDAGTYKNTYGALYNWYTTTDVRNVCPSGWHVPSDAEWTTLVTFLGGESLAGGKLKETGTTHWVSPNTGATNETGFTALPGGCRYNDGPFHQIGFYGDYWSSTENGLGWFRRMYNDQNQIHNNPDNFQEGFSVRCIKD